MAEQQQMPEQQQMVEVLSPIQSPPLLSLSPLLNSTSATVSSSPSPSPPLPMVRTGGSPLLNHASSEYARRRGLPYSHPPRERLHTFRIYRRGSAHPIFSSWDTYQNEEQCETAARFVVRRRRLSRYGELYVECERRSEAPVPPRQCVDAKDEKELATYLLEQKYVQKIQFLFGEKYEHTCRSCESFMSVMATPPQNQQAVFENCERTDPRDDMEEGFETLLHGVYHAEVVKEWRSRMEVLFPQIHCIWYIKFESETYIKERFFSEFRKKKVKEAVLSLIE